MSTTINGTTGVTFPDNTSQNTAATGFGFRNRIINGSMTIDQRNAGASVSVSTDAGNYSVDRWKVGANGGGVFSVQRSTTAPSGFTNSLLVTVTTADSSLAATDYYVLQQRIEGYNVSDLGWGTAGAATVTLSFWVRSSLTGTFGGSFYNNAANRSYPFTYTISSANTWEQKTVTVAGDTTGTWTTDNTAGLTVNFSLGAGSNYTDSAAGSWYGSLEFGASGQINPIATNGATFYITGVQLEKGSTATSFDYRPYGTELALCQRYYWRNSVLASTTINVGNYSYPVPMRVPPSITVLSTNTGSGVSYGVLNYSGSNSLGNLYFYQSTANSAPGTAAVETSGAEL